MDKQLILEEKIVLLELAGVIEIPYNESEIDKLLDELGFHLEKRLIERMGFSVSEIRTLYKLLKVYEERYGNRYAAFGVMITKNGNSGILVYRAGKWRTLMLRNWRVNHSGIVYVVGKIQKLEKGFKGAYCIPPTRFDSVKWKWIDEKPKRWFKIE